MNRATLALIAALALGGCSPAPAPEDSRQVPNPSPTATASASHATPPAPAPHPSYRAGTYPVDRVVDGDTVRIIRDGKSVPLRLIGGDTPETVHPSKPVQCYGPEASAEAKRLLTGKEVRIVYDPTQGRETDDGRRVDYYDRDLVYLTLPDGRDFMEYMIATGHAEEYTYRGDPYQRQKTYRDAETRARNTGEGLWTACK